MADVDTSEQGANPVTVLVQVAGLIVLVGGLFSAAQVVSRGWALLEKPATIVPFAEEIERQTHLNQFVGQFNLMFEFFRRANSALPPGVPLPAKGDSIYDPVPYPTKGAPAQQTLPTDSATAAPREPNASYFVAWIITIILLGLIARISLWAVTEGGKLVLFSGNQDRQLKRVIRELAAEIRRPQSSANS